MRRAAVRFGIFSGKTGEVLMFSVLRFFLILRILTDCGRRRPLATLFSLAVFCALIYSVVR
jgi:hypothetical protein